MAAKACRLTSALKPRIIMPKFVCSYAHDIACFADFVVEAKSKKAALRKIRKALREGKFEKVDATPSWENGATNERVFVHGIATEYSPDAKLEQLTGQEHRLSSHTAVAFAVAGTPMTRPLKTRPVKHRKEKQ
jgi:hypothetical protein